MPGEANLGGLLEHCPRLNVPGRIREEVRRQADDDPARGLHASRAWLRHEPNESASVTVGEATTTKSSGRSTPQPAIPSQGSPAPGSTAASRDPEPPPELDSPERSTPPPDTEASHEPSRKFDALHDPFAAAGVAAISASTSPAPTLSRMIRRSMALSCLRVTSYFYLHRSRASPRWGFGLAALPASHPPQTRHGGEFPIHPRTGTRRRAPCYRPDSFLEASRNRET